jgi:DNA-binding CsgD family transcriptional regulator
MRDQGDSRVLRVLYGRDAERAAIDRLLVGARSGRSGVLAIRGEAGIGKSALLKYAVDTANGMGVLQGTGIESESELAFAGLHQLLRPVLTSLDEIPEPHANALRAGFGLAQADGDLRFLVAAGTLSVLAEAAEHGPLLCVVDDVQWVDQPSLEALVFVARRLEAERVALLLAMRDDDRAPGSLAGLPHLELGGLPSDAAGALLDAHAGPTLDTGVRTRLVAASAGNPLALVELACQLRDTQLAGLEPLPDPLPLGKRLRRVFAPHIHRLPRAAQTALLVAAADDSGDLTVVLRAAARLGLDPAALGPAEVAGLIRLDPPTVAFGHPLVRSAVYRAATFAQRRDVHRALASVLDSPAGVDRRAWHLAAASVEPDEQVAVELERASERARQRSGYAAAATAMERAARLTPDDARRGGRLVAAGEAAWLGGQRQRASRLLDRAEPLVAVPADHARLAYLRGMIEANHGAPRSGYQMLLDAAAPAAGVDAHLARSMLIEAGRIALLANDTARMTAVAERLADMWPADRGAAGLLAFATGAQRLLAGDPDRAVAVLREALVALRVSCDIQLRAMAPVVAAALGDAALGVASATDAVGACRARGTLSWLPLALMVLASLEWQTGLFDLAVADATEGLDLARELDQEAPTSHCLSVLALAAAVRGDEQRCREHAGTVLGTQVPYRATPAAGMATVALGVLEIGLGRLEHALDVLARLFTAPEAPRRHPIVLLIATGDLVEAAVRAGRPQAIEPVLRSASSRFARWATAVRQPWALAVAARCRALFAIAEHDPEPHFQDALRLDQTAVRPFEHARTQLLYGEWLRRERRRADARPWLRSAQETFERLGATPWVDRARTELRAAGEVAGRRDTGMLAQLTPQELQVVRIVRTGATNREAAARLFLSPRTIEYHLRKVYAKLGISSRIELAGLPLE